MFNFILLIFFESFDNRILDISILKEFEKAALKYFSLEKFTLISPLTLMLFIVNTFSSPKLFVNEINKNMIAVKKIKIYSFKITIKYFDKK